MKPNKIKILVIGFLIAAGITVSYIKGTVDGLAGKTVQLVREAQAAGGKVTDPKGTAPDRYVYTHV